MYIDYKATVWFRIPIKDDSKETLDKCIDLLTAGATPNDLYDELYDKLYSCEVLWDSEEFLYPEDNSTIEVFDEHGAKIWDNHLNTNYK